LAINDLVKYVSFEHTSAKHVKEMMLKAFPFIADTGYIPLRYIKHENGKIELVKVENRFKNLELMKE